MPKRLSRFSRRSVIGAIVGLAFAAAAGVGLAQVGGSHPAMFAAATDSTSSTTSTSTNSTSTTTSSTTSTSGSTTTTSATTPTRTSTTTVAQGAGQEKVTVCHKTGSSKNRGHTIVIAKPAVAAHVAHGDSEGKCAETPATTPTTTVHAQKPKKPKKPKKQKTTHASDKSKSHGSSKGGGGQSHAGGQGKGK